MRAIATVKTRSTNISPFSRCRETSYYDLVQGPIHFFMLDSDSREPDGTSSSSKQALWLKEKLAGSNALFNVMVAHQPPFTSGDGQGATAYMCWPFKSWGADAVLSGDDHLYERVSGNDGLPYFVNGLGGNPSAKISAARRPAARCASTTTWAPC
jgi:hypothetical protein